MRGVNCMQVKFQEMNYREICEMYGSILEELKRRKKIRTNNLVGDLGEQIAIEYFNTNPDLPNLYAAEIGTKNVDAINSINERYSIKSTTTNITGVFNGLNDITSTHPQEKLFDYVLIVVLNKSLSFTKICVLRWEDFLHLKKWNKSKKTWYLTITKQLEEKAKVYYG
jgi:hypothetical protein